jgi:hypothetical protein
VFRLSKVGVGDEGAEASSRTDAQAGGALRRATGRCPPCPSAWLVLSQLRQHERAGVEDFMVMRTSCALHGRKMHTTGDFCSHVANPQVMTITSRESAGDGLCR